MFFDPANFRHPAFRQGMVDTLKVAPGIWAWGLMTGVAMVQAGLGPAMSTLMTLLVYGGSAQLAAIPLLGAGAPAWVILATAFCVNLRFAVFSLHLRQYMMAWPRWQRLSIGYFIADLNYVQFVERYPQPASHPDDQRSEMAYLCGNCFLNWAGWQIASLVGIVLAAQIPSPIARVFARRIGIGRHLVFTESVAHAGDFTGGLRHCRGGCVCAALAFEYSGGHRRCGGRLLVDRTHIAGG